jgi:TPR repeat protein
MDVISLAAAITLTEWSERTFWRRFNEGVIKKESRNGKAVISFAAISDNLCVPLDAEDLLLLERADGGDPSAQTELALHFLRHRRPKGALAWLGLAAKQDDANAMYFLGRCYIDGDSRGIERDENLGLMWVSRAACHGSILAAAVMQSIRDRIGMRV